MTLMGSCNEFGGYGLLATSLFRGIEGDIVPIGRKITATDLQKRVVSYKKQAIDVLVSPVFDNMPKAKRLFTMWEADDIPFGDQLKKFESLIVPTDFDADIFRKYFTGKIDVCPLGVDAVYSPPQTDPFQFTFIGADHGVPERKRAQWVVDEFSKTFKFEDDVRLVMLVDREAAVKSFDTRVTIIRKEVSAIGYDRILRNTSVGVVVGGMEGWSFPAHQFIATGKPVIAPLWGGITGILTEECTFSLGYMLIPAPEHEAYKGVGMRAWADGLGVAMARSYDNRLDVIKKGLAGYERAQNFTIQKMIERFKACL
jgi:glycosyltransferase involved in cell wall biosynthesis